MQSEPSFEHHDIWVVFLFSFYENNQNNAGDETEEKSHINAFKEMALNLVTLICNPDFPSEPSVDTFFQNCCKLCSFLLSLDGA